MGPSGAGKTTFITTLTSKAHYGVRTGRVLVNGRDDDLSRYRTLTGFVPQEDVMLHELTAGENLYFSGRARLPRCCTDAEVRAAVADTLTLLALTADRDVAVSELTSGKRKAVNIGMELVARPRLLFVDEPTTGLDSTSSLSICALLHRISRRGRITVVAVVHQPRFDAFKMFDDVLLLGRGGRTVYLGPTGGALGYACMPACLPACLHACILLQFFLLLLLLLLSYYSSISCRTIAGRTFHHPSMLCSTIAKQRN
jgi:ABC-type multidrug transport system ATPase subunit